LHYFGRFNPTGNQYHATVNAAEFIMDTATDSVVAAFESPWNDSYSVRDRCFSHDGKRLYFLADGELFVYDCAVGGLATATAKPPNWCRSIAAHPDGRVLATVEDGRAVTFRDAETLEVLRTYDFAMPTVTCVAFTPDGTRCVIGNSRGKVLLFDVD